MFVLRTQMQTCGDRVEITRKKIQNKKIKLRNRNWSL